MTRINVQGAKARIAELLDRVEGGEQIAITRNGKEIAMLMPYVARPRRTGYASLRGQIDAQAQGEAATLVTDDEKLASYDVPTIRARG